MKISAIVLVCFLAYAMASAGDGDGTSGTAGEKQGTRQQPVSSQGVATSRYIPATGTARGRTTNTQTSTARLLRLLVVITIINSMTTTKAPEPEPTTAMETTMASTTVTTPSPYAGWITVGTCVYQMQTDIKTAEEAKTDCTAKKSNLAVNGFQGLTTAARKDLIMKVGGLSQTFWIDVTADESTTTAGTIDATTDKYNVVNSPNNPSEDGITLTLATGASGTGLCGRFSATNTDELEFEGCTGNKFRYLCEFCGSV